MLLFEAYRYDKEREHAILRLHPKLSPYSVSVLPLARNKPELVAKANAIRKDLLSQGIGVHYDDTGSIGRRYARQDELGTPWCITIDFASLEDEAVTLRDRDTAEQKRVAITSLPDLLPNLISQQQTFSSL